MLSLFPTLLSYTLAVPFLFRLTLAVLFLVFAYQNIAHRNIKKVDALEKFNLRPGHLWLWIMALLEVIGGILLIFGLYTQGASLGLSILLLLGAIAKYKDKNSISLSLEVILLLLLITSSLLFLGPGFFSVDRPL